MSPIIAYQIISYHKRKYHVISSIIIHIHTYIHIYIYMQIYVCITAEKQIGDTNIEKNIQETSTPQTNINNVYHAKQLQICVYTTKIYIYIYTHFDIIHFFTKPKNILIFSNIHQNNGVCSHTFPTFVPIRQKPPKPTKR